MCDKLVILSDCPIRASTAMYEPCFEILVHGENIFIMTYYNMDWRDIIGNSVGLTQLILGVQSLLNLTTHRNFKHHHS